jgi:type IV pilus biogenesis protein CpaD/CtpE
MLWSGVSGTLVTPDGDANNWQTWQTIRLDLSSLLESSGIDPTHVVDVQLQISTPSAAAAEAGATYQTADVRIHSFVIQ